ncbi:hypothetical protein AURDEDRAFT_166455 [Auricularia subglabra TFB-10046 SS5]|nr:hypothetical protein AURDEDRAFT_166455 [Auricularia subglabra TFB-10046 SS5]
MPEIAAADSAPSRPTRARLPLDPQRKPRCLPKGKFRESCVGHVYWTFCSVYEPLLSGLGEYMDAPMSAAMLDDQSWLSDTIASGDPDCCLPCRPAIIERVFDSQEANVFCMATFGGVPIQQADPHLQHYAVALEGTSP